MSLPRFFRFCLALARELSDEGAYQRYLEQSGKLHSPDEWRTFIDRRHKHKYQNAKCC